MSEKVEQREDLWVFRYSIPHPDYKRPYLDYGHYVYTSEEEAQDHFVEVFKSNFDGYYEDCEDVDISEYSYDQMLALYMKDVDSLDSQSKEESYMDNKLERVIENLPVYERTLLRSNRQKSATSDSLGKRIKSPDNSDTGNPAKIQKLDKDDSNEAKQ